MKMDKFDFELEANKKSRTYTWRELINSQLDGKTVQAECDDGSWVDLYSVLGILTENLDVAVNGYRVKEDFYPKYSCNGVELDICEYNPKSRFYYVPALTTPELYTGHFWGLDEDIDKHYLKNGLLYNCKQKAVKHAKAMLKRVEIE